jgi:hypothetical protein
MNTYTYTDRSEYPQIWLVFGCIAESLMVADEKYKAATGSNPSKQPHIHCQIEFRKTAGA